MTINGLKNVIIEEGLQLNHNYSISSAPKAEGGGFILKCGGNFVFWDLSLDKVLSRYCMQVVEDTVCASFFG